MRRLGSPVPDHGGQRVGLPAEVEKLLVDVVADGFAMYCCGPKVGVSLRNVSPSANRDVLAGQRSK
jgi:hypothetical protein